MPAQLPEGTITSSNEPTSVFLRSSPSKRCALSDTLDAEDPKQTWESLQSESPTIKWTKLSELDTPERIPTLSLTEEPLTPRTLSVASISLVAHESGLAFPYVDPSLLHSFKSYKSGISFIEFCAELQDTSKMCASDTESVGTTDKDTLNIRSTRAYTF